MTSVAKSTAAMAIIPNSWTFTLSQRERMNGQDVARQLSEQEKITITMMALFSACPGHSREALEIARVWFRDYEYHPDDPVNFDVDEAWNAWEIDPPWQVRPTALYDIADQARPGWQREWHREYVGWRQGPVEPVDLWGSFDPPLLPRGLTPSVIEEFAFEQGEIMGADPAGLAAGALVICAAVVSDKILLKVKRHDDWTEAARIWVALIGDPSSKKTPIMLRVARPLNKIDAKMWHEYIKAKEQYDALSAEQRRTEPKPKQKRLRIEDTTIEAAQEILKDSPDGVFCYQDELSGWFGGMDKYAGGSRAAAKDRGFWLQAYNGGSYGYHRVTRGSGLIENLSVSMLGGIQPEPMRKVAADTVADGLIQRLIPVVLKPAVVGKDEGEEETPQEAGEKYNDLIKRLHALEQPFEDYRFDDGALRIRRQLEQKHHDLIAVEAINKKLAAHIGKYDGLFARLCLIWQCIENPQSIFITEATARRVRDFMHRFLLPHAIAFYARVLGLSDEHERLTAVAGYILARRLDRITNRDVQRGDRTMRKLDRRDIESIFNQLDALGWVTREPGPRATDPPHWVVNPEVHVKFAARAQQEAERRQREREMITELLRGNG
jgi:hypothetical protein